MSRGPRTIVAIGGGSFRTYPGNALDTWLLARTGATRPRVAFLPTASGDQEGAIEAFTRSFLERGAVPTVVRLFVRDIVDLEATLLAQDLILVSGGNTANLMAVWQLHGVDAILRAAYEQGTVLSGWSAGGLCWFEGGVTDSFHITQLAPLTKLLGILPGSFCPHYNSEENRRPTYRGLVAAGTLPAGLAADDGVGLLYEDGAFREALGFLPGGSAWRVEADGAGGARETAIAARQLPGA
ncbi:MAG: peptidase E [Candidatus Eisenbacteria bacterium]